MHLLAATFCSLSEDISCMCRKEWQIATPCAARIGNMHVLQAKSPAFNAWVANVQLEQSLNRPSSNPAALLFLILPCGIDCQHAACVVGRCCGCGRFTYCVHIMYSVQWDLLSRVCPLISLHKLTVCSSFRASSHVKIFCCVFGHFKLAGTSSFEIYTTNRCCEFYLHKLQIFHMLQFF